MGLLDRFRQKKPEELEVDPLADLVLHKLRVGYLVDHDLETWKVTAYNRYHFNSGATSEEWELTAGRTKRYLELAQSDGETWTLARTIPLGAVEHDVRQHIVEHDDPPEQVTHKGTTYYLDDSDGGTLKAGGKEERREFFQWEFLDDGEEGFLTIQQWSETEFSAACGVFVEDYQFTDILPGEPE